MSDARHEATAARRAREAGVPVPRVHGCLVHDGRPGVVYDRIAGSSMLARLGARPWTVLRLARRFAALHAAIHATEAGEPDAFRDRLAKDVREAPGISPEIRERASRDLAALPRGEALCHGDFHPGNVLVAGDGPVVIDWLDAVGGHPAADVARTSVLLRFAGRQRASRWTGVLRRIFRWRYFQCYCDRTAVTHTQVRRWELPVAVARLTEDVPEEPRLRSFIEDRVGSDVGSSRRSD